MTWRWSATLYIITLNTDVHVEALDTYIELADKGVAVWIVQMPG